MDLPAGVEFDNLSDKQKDYVEEFLCNNTRVYYEEQEFYDYIGTKPWSNFQQYIFECRIQRWANDFIRINFLAGVGGQKRFIGKRWNDRFIVAKNFDSFEAIHRNKLEDTETMNCKKSSIYTHMIKIDYSKKMNGLNTTFLLYNTGSNWNQTEPERNFNNWNFINKEIWQQFEFNINNTKLFSTKYHILGEQSSQFANIQIFPEI